MAAPGDEVAAAYLAMTNAARWLETRTGMDPATARFAARNVLEILYPYAMIDVHAKMADGLRAAGADAIADTVDEVRHHYVTKLTQPMEEET